jgi:hypothetical protein
MIYLRLTSIFDQYFGRDSGLVNIKDLVKYSKRPAQELYDYGVYDKVGTIFDMIYHLIMQYDVLLV